MAPRVSILLSVYNGRPYLDEALRSILAQTYEDFELIIIDDASTDGSTEDLAGFAGQDARIKVLRNPENLGLTSSLNRGLQEARGQFIARQDADDVSLPDRLGKQVAAFDASPELALLGTGLIEMDAHGHQDAISLQPSLAPVIKRKMLFDNAFFHSSVMWRREYFQIQGLAYNQNFIYGQDYDLFSRAVWQVECSNLAEPLIMFRKHIGQVSKTRVEDQQSLADRVAWRNFQSFGLGKQFAPEEVGLLRKLGIRSGGLSRPERRRQWDLWLRLFTLLEEGLSPQERDEWKQVKQVRLKLLRRTLAAPPILWNELAKLFTMDPWGALADMAGIASNRLSGGRV